jgi:hypothetical protein
MHPECLFQVAQMQYTVKEWLYCLFLAVMLPLCLTIISASSAGEKNYYTCAAFLRMNLEPNHWVTVRTVLLPGNQASDQ